MKHSGFPTIEFKSTFILLLILLSSCATQKAVRKAVADSNVAIVALFVDQPDLMLPDRGMMNSPDWRVPVNEMQRIIDNNPNQPVLVNQLWVRQAWVLTVYGQDELAKQVWRNVQREHLHSERAANLYANRNCLVWFFNKSKDASWVAIEGSDVKMARQYIDILDSSVAKIKSIELKPYFATLSARLALMISSGADSSVTGEMESALENLPSDLNKFINAFKDSERKCANDSANLKKESTIITARNCVFLKTIYDEYIARANLLKKQGHSIDMPKLDNYITKSD